MNKVNSMFAIRLLRSFCPPQLLEEIEGDLIEKYERDVKTFDEQKAKRKLVWNAIRFFRLGIILRNKFSKQMNEPILLKSYLKTTVRHIQKNKVNFAFKVSGLSLAFISLLIIMLYVSYQLSFDRHYADYEKIYRVNSIRKEDGKLEKYGIAPLALGPMLFTNYPEIASYTRIQLANESLIKYSKKITSGIVCNADSSLFNVFTFNFLKGNKNALQKPFSIVLSQSFALKIFGNEDPLHKVITINDKKHLYEVTGVFEDMKPNSHLVLDAFIPIEDNFSLSLNEITDPVKFLDHSSMLYVRFKETSKAELLQSKIKSLLTAHFGKKELRESGFGIYLQPIKNIYLDSSIKYDFSQKGNPIYLYLFIALGFFLLIIASINYINLCITDFSSRAKETGIRKIMGAMKKQIVSQTIIETTFYCGLALLLSIGILYLLFPSLQEILSKHLEFGQLLNKKIVVGICCLLLLMILSSALIPAFMLIKSKAIHEVKGIAQISSFRLANNLLLVQLIISTFCLCSTIVVSKQIRFIQNKDLGFDKKNLLLLSLPETFMTNQLKTLKQQLLTVSGVTNVSNSSFRIGGGYWKDWYEVEIKGEMKSLELHEVFSDDDLLNTLKMKIIDGRFLNAKIHSDSGAAFVMNETAAKELGIINPIGKRIRTHTEEKGKWDGTIVGVVGDVNIRTLHQKVEPLIMRLPWQNKYPELFLYIRFEGNPNRIVSEVNKKYSELLPEYPIELNFVDDAYNNEYQDENRAFASLKFSAIIILLISSIGIFSLSALMASKRMKEFGIRKVLGAGVTQITVLQVSRFLKLTVIANVISFPIGYWVMNNWLENFAYQTDINSTQFLIVFVSSLALVILSVGYSAFKVGRMNPIDVIKTE